jgi:hypothetical protein
MITPMNPTIFPSIFVQQKRVVRIKKDLPKFAFDINKKKNKASCDYKCL